jgi:hypothetical protein
LGSPSIENSWRRNQKEDPKLEPFFSFFNFHFEIGNSPLRLKAFQILETIPG